MVRIERMIGGRREEAARRAGGEEKKEAGAISREKMRREWSRRSAAGLLGCLGKQRLCRLGVRVFRDEGKGLEK